MIITINDLLVNLFAAVIYDTFRGEMKIYTRKLPPPLQVRIRICMYQVSDPIYDVIMLVYVVNFMELESCSHCM